MGVWAVMDVGASALDRKEAKKWKAAMLQRLGAQADKAPRTPASIGKGMANKQVWAADCLSLTVCSRSTCRKFSMASSRVICGRYQTALQPHSVNACIHNAGCA